MCYQPHDIQMFMFVIITGAPNGMFCCNVFAIKHRPKYLSEAKGSVLATFYFSDVDDFVLYK